MRFPSYSSATFISALIAISLAVPAHSDEKSLWISQNEIDKMDDSHTTAIYRYADTVVYSPNLQKQNFEKKGVILLSCTAKRFAARIILRNTLLAGVRYALNYRFDARAPVTAKGWAPLDDYSTLEMRSRTGIKTLANQISRSKKLFLRVEDGVFGTTEMTFNLDGFFEAYKPVKEACGL